MARSSALKSLVVLVFAVGAMLSLASSASASFGYVNGLNMHGGGPSGDLLQWGAMNGLDRASDGSLFVLDDGPGRVVKLDSDGKFVKEFGSNGAGDGQFQTLLAIAISPTTGNVYVVSGGSTPGVQVFDQDGVFQFRWGSYGTGNGQFNYPSGIAFDSLGNVYVSDTVNHRVQYFNSSGTWQGNFGDASAPGQLASPRGVGIGSDGAVYVVDAGFISPSYHARVVVFNGPNQVSPLAYSRSFGTYDFTPGNFLDPRGIAVQPGTPDEVYVTEGFYQHRVQRFNGQTGALLSRWGYDYAEGPFNEGYGPEQGKFNDPTQIILDSSNNAWVSDAGNHRIQRFSNANAVGGATFSASLGNDGTAPGQFRAPSAVAAAPDGSAYVAEFPATGSTRIQHVSAKGAVLHTFALSGSLDGQTEDVHGMSVGPGGDLWVADSGNNRVVRFSASGGFKANVVNVNGADLTNPRDVVVAADGTVYIADTGNRRIAVIEADGLTERQWGSNGYGGDNADFQSLYSLALSPDGAHVYALDDVSNRVKEFSSAGVFEHKTGVHSGGGTGDGEFKYPDGLDVDPTAGEVLVSDTENDRIQRLSPDLAFVSKFGPHGRGDGELQKPDGVSVDTNGYLWVADRESNRVQRFGDAPGVQISSPSAGTSTSSTSLTVNYLVTDAGADCNLANGSSVGPLALGSHTITVTCSNAQGVGAASVPVTIIEPLTNPRPTPTFKLTLAKKLKLATRLKFSVTCDVGCTVGGKLKIGAKSYKLKAAVLAGRETAQRVSLKLSKLTYKKATLALAKKKKVTLTVAVTPPPAYKATQGKTGKASISR